MVICTSSITRFFFNFWFYRSYTFYTRYFSFLNLTWIFLLCLHLNVRNAKFVGYKYFEDTLCKTFLSWFSDLVELKNDFILDSLTHIFPSFLWPSQRRRSFIFATKRKMVNIWNWFTQRSRILSLLQSGSCWARSDQRVNGCSNEFVTASITTYRVFLICPMQVRRHGPCRCHGWILWCCAQCFSKSLCSFFLWL